MMHISSILNHPTAPQPQTATSTSSGPSWPASSSPHAGTLLPGNISPNSTLKLNKKKEEYNLLAISVSNAIEDKRMALTKDEGVEAHYHTPDGLRLASGQKRKANDSDPAGHEQGLSGNGKKQVRVASDLSAMVGPAQNDPAS